MDFLLRERESDGGGAMNQHYNYVTELDHMANRKH